MKQIGIISGSGFVAGELIRIILTHPEVELNYVQSDSQAGKMVTGIHSDLVGECSLRFTRDADPDIDVLFVCKAHGESAKFLNGFPLNKETVVIDLSQDFRIKNDSHQFVYGLPELNRKEIARSRFIANPGCFATAIQLALLPLAHGKLLNHPVHIHAITGSTGAGIRPTDTTHFSWRNNNLSVYKPFVHQHLDEINQSIRQLDPGFNQDLAFIPVRGGFSRGIFASLCTKLEWTGSPVFDLYRDYYRTHEFVWISEENIHLKQVINTNKCLIHLVPDNGRLLIVSIIDNLIKGAAGQAIQNMNLALGIPESTGLKIKAMAY